ncbi:hypothetical protein LWI29_029398 [Acer saccharum]|uniref:phytol kinase n=1 Tax=Acer saccharum TaxID=4024 RepID=A0AA39VWU0_ACESA|nr:hypothetical protein LWI29_029398 [Acer saccharum]
MTAATLLSSSSSCSFTLLRSRPTIIRRHIIPTTTHHHPLRFPSPNLPGLVCRAAIAGDLLRDVGATAAVLVGAYGLVRSFDSLTKRNIIQQSLSRKLVHIMSGLLFVVSWPIFSTSMEARYFASFVPLVNCLRLIVHGLSLVKDEGLIKSVTREGKPEELLKGPLYYVLILMLCAVVFWRESPIGVVSLGMMCAGDGFADIIGRRFGSMKIFYNPKKSWAGSISMFISGFLISSGMLYYYSVLGYFKLDWVLTMEKVALVCLVATVVESLPTAHLIDDNISVPLSSMLAAYLSFGY